MSGAQESFLAKLVSLIVKVGALVAILFIPTQFAIDFQLLGGVWMIQIFPALVFGLFTRWFNGWALLAGWAVGMVLAYGPAKWVPSHDVFGAFTAYNGIIGIVANMAVATLLSQVLPNRAPDETTPQDYEAGQSIHV